MKQLAPAMNSDGRLELFGIGMDNALWHIWQTAPHAGPWSSWTSRGGIVKKIAAARDKAFTDEVLAGMDAWLPTVRQMRPLSPWDDVVRVLNQKPGQDWTPERLRRAVKRAVREKVADPVLLQTAPRSLPDDRLMMLVAGISIANPDLTIRAIASQLEQMRERTPRGSTKWSPSSAQHLLDQARKLGFTPADTDGSPVRP